MIPWKLVVVVVVAILLALFIGFNVNNKCEISFVLGKVDAVPVYLTVLFSFVAGMAAALPFAFKKRSAKAKSGLAGKPGKPGTPGEIGKAGTEPSPVPADAVPQGRAAPEAAGESPDSEAHGREAGKRGRRK